MQVSSLIKKRIAKGGDEGRSLWKCLRDGEPIPDEVYEEIIKDRLSQMDVKMNGFVLDGFPLNSNQMKFLVETCNIRPSHLLYLEINDHKAYER